MFRTGIGFDVHALAEGLPLVIGGVNIPHSRGLQGHSDADVLVHAVMDAILGSLALGDIGAHFQTQKVNLKEQTAWSFLVVFKR